MGEPQLLFRSAEIRKWRKDVPVSYTHLDVYKRQTLMVAMGLLVVMISGGIDVSFMAIALFGSYTTIQDVYKRQ